MERDGKGRASGRAVVCGGAEREKSGLRGGLAGRQLGEEGIRDRILVGEEEVSGGTTQDGSVGARWLRRRRW